ncbi:MAG: hypothetical protein WAT92_16655 [Saprospiraceae bacterium]
MPIYKLEGNNIIKLKRTTFSEEKISEARDLQKFIINSIEILERNLFVISSEFGDWEDSRRRIDILCLDKNANLVVVELKITEDGGHMELQSIRYAAMIANMTFDKAEKAFHYYIEKNNLPIENPKEAILNFLEWDDVNEEDFANDVRIILVSANFSKEITTSVLWLIERDLDIKCIRIKPQRDGSNLYFDIQQIIPLPEAADYQVKLREKAAEQRLARRETNRDYSKFDVSINGKFLSNLNKRKTIYFVINECLKAGISPIELMEITSQKKWIWVDKICQNRQDFEEEIVKNMIAYDPSRWFNESEELLKFGGKTYAFSNQFGKSVNGIVINIFAKYPDLNGVITKKEI